MHARDQQRCAQGIVDLALIHKPDGILPGHQQVAHHHRGVEHVAAAHVERPGDVIEHVAHVDGGLFPAHHLADGGELILCAAAGIALLQRECLALGHRRAVLPQLGEPVARIGQRDAARIQVCAHCIGGRGADHGKVHAHCVAFLRERIQIGLLGGGARRAHAHERHAAAGKLVLRLDEVAPVRKQRGLFPADDQRPGRAREPAQPLARLEVIGKVFGSMAVRRGHDDGSHVLRLHLCPERGDSFGNLHHDVIPPSKGDGSIIHRAPERLNPLLHALSRPAVRTR